MLELRPEYIVHLIYATIVSIPCNLILPAIVIRITYDRYEAQKIKKINQFYEKD